MIKAYIDCNVLLDWLLDREPHSTFAARIIEMVENGEIEGYVSALGLANTYYLLQKSINRKVADAFLIDAEKLFFFLPMEDTTVREAIRLRHRDFEDDLHYHAALAGNLDCIITRNSRDFRTEGIRILEPEMFLDEMSGES